MKLRLVDSIPALACAVGLAIGAPALAADSAASKAPAAKPTACPNPVMPGRAIGALRLGMTLDEVRALGQVTEPGNAGAGGKAWYTANVEKRSYRFTVGADRRVNAISARESKVCLQDGAERVFDMRARNAQAVSPMVGCALEAAAHRVAWDCTEQGVVLAWENGESTVYVQPPPKGEVAAEPPPPPPWFARLPGCAAVRHPKLACAFFGGNATLECYPIEPCMGILSKESAEHATLYTAEGDRLGTFKLARSGWSLAHKFATPPVPGTRFRIFFDRKVGGTVGHTAQEQARTRRPLVEVKTSREFADGFVLYVEAPQPAEDMSSQCRFFGGDKCFKTLEEACAAKGCAKAKCSGGKGDPAEIVCKK